MPGITPSKFRGQANGIINFMGGLGALLVFFGGKPLYDRRVSLPFMVTSKSDMPLFLCPPACRSQELRRKRRSVSV